MSGHDLGEDAYNAFIVAHNALTGPATRIRPWDLLSQREQGVWEKVVAAVVLRLLLNNLAEAATAHGAPSFALPEDTISPIIEEIERKTGKARGAAPDIQLLQEEVEAVQAAIAEIERNANVSCGKCGQPDACCDGDCASAAICAKNVGILRALLHRAGVRCAALKGG
jgi:hypothetical protein